MSISTQEAWLFGGTIRENILMNSEMDMRRYQRVVNASCLKTDLKILKDGDQTLVGEKGATLSGGQKARVSLARCLYAQEGSLSFEFGTTKACYFLSVFGIQNFGPKGFVTPLSG